MRCLACDLIIPDKDLRIDDRLCLKCLNIAMVSVRQLELDDLKKDNTDGSSQPPT